MLQRQIVKALGEQTDIEIQHTQNMLVRIFIP